MTGKLTYNFYQEAFTTISKIVCGLGDGKKKKNCICSEIINREWNVYGIIQNGN